MLLLSQTTLLLQPVLGYSHEPIFELEATRLAKPRKLAQQCLACPVHTASVLGT